MEDRIVAAFFSLSPRYPSVTRKGLREDVSRPDGMVCEHKEQAEKTDANSMLSVSLVSKAQQIEKTGQNRARIWPKAERASPLFSWETA